MARVGKRRIRRLNKEQEKFTDANKEVERVERTLQELERFKFEGYSDTIMS